MRLLRRLRAGLPHRDALREVADRERPGRAQRHHHLRLLRRRLLVPRRDAGRGGRAHGAQFRRACEPRSLLREGSLRHRLCDPPRSHPEAHDPQADHRPLAGSVLGGSDRLCRERAQAHSKEVRPKFHRRHHFLALHERGDLPRAEADPRRLRQQQRRHLRTGLSLAHRLRLEEHPRRVGRHPEFRLGDAGGRDLRHRRQSHRRPSGIRLADEAPAATGCEADRRRSAPDRSGALAAHRRGLSPASSVRAPMSH